MNRNIQQGAVVVVQLDPTRGNEQSGERPCVVISGDAFHVSGMVIVCPLTTSLKGYYGNVLLVPSKCNGLRLESEVLTGQVRVVSMERCKNILGRITVSELKAIHGGLDDILGK